MCGSGSSEIKQISCPKNVGITNLEYRLSGGARRSSAIAILFSRTWRARNLHLDVLTGIAKAAVDGVNAVVSSSHLES